MKEACRVCGIATGRGVEHAGALIPFCGDACAAAHIGGDGSAMGVHELYAAAVAERDQLRAAAAQGDDQLAQLAQQSRDARTAIEDRRRDDADWYHRAEEQLYQLDAMLLRATATQRELRMREAQADARVHELQRRLMLASRFADEFAAAPDAKRRIVDSQ